MTSNYCFKFESNGINIIVNFFEAQKSIDAAETLAQVGHASRRKWALNLIKFLIETNVFHFQFDEKTFHRNCPFGNRLKAEEWNRPTVTLTLTKHQQVLSIYRLYYLYLSNFTYSQAFLTMLTCHNCRTLQ